MRLAILVAAFLLGCTFTCGGIITLLQSVDLPQQCELIINTTMVKGVGGGILGLGIGLILICFITFLGDGESRPWWER